MMNVEFVNPSTQAAGGVVSGTLVLRPEEDVTVQASSVSLHWRTEGRGDKNEMEVGSVDLGALGALSPREERRFAFELPIHPDGPVTYDGKLIRVIWEIRVHLDVPWAWDKRQEFPVRVVPRGGEDEPGVPESLFLERGLPVAPRPRGMRFLQVIGPKGAGKTTSLLHWRRSAPGPYRHVPPGAGRWLPLPAGPLVYWDEADRIPLPVFAAGLAACRAFGATVVAGTHEDVAGLPERLGFAVETFELPPIAPEEVLDWARIRVAGETAGGSAGFQVDRALAEAVAAEAGRSWRRVGGLLHRRAADAASTISL
jgi:hypothetical protein